ncbi:MAG: putative DNA binding domain-containing protein [Bacteroidales bacterium]|nr:putative DNA binding domain-containing protein [Bacteroidales bacterium]
MSWIEDAIKNIRSSLYPVKVELNELDWKSGLSEKSERLAQHISAFANQVGGGTFAFGVNNDSTLFTPTREQAEDIVGRLGNIARNNLHIPIKLEHASAEYEGHGILFVHVPEQFDKPVYLRGKTIYDSYYRSAGQTHKMSRQQVHDMIAAKEGIAFEERVAASGLSAEQIITLLDFGEFYKLTGKPVPTGADSIAEGLANHNFCKKLERDWAITNLGAALFARDLRSFPSLEFRYVVVRQYKGTNNRDISAETFFYEGYAVSLDKIVKYVMSLLEKTENILHPQRENKYPYPEVAIRELAANMVLHQSFDVHGMTLAIEIFTNRIVMTNPGAPLIDTNRFIDLPPKSRNDKMAQAMFLFNLCEKRGSGMDRAVEGIEAMHLPAITIEKGEDFTRARLFPLKKYTEMSKTEKIYACYQHACLLYEDGMALTNQSLRDRLSIGKNNAAVASRIISDTIASGLIKPQEGQSASTKFWGYVPYYV